MDARGKEIATLRAIGFSSKPVLASVLIEGLLLALGAAIIGALIPWFIFNGRVISALGLTFPLVVSPHLILISIVWALAIGPSRAVAGLTAGPRQVLTYLGGIGRYPGHLLRPLGAYAGLAHWLPEQFPLALILASAEVFGLSWLMYLGHG